MTKSKVLTFGVIGAMLFVVATTFAQQNAVQTPGFITVTEVVPPPSLHHTVALVWEVPQPSVVRTQANLRTNNEEFRQPYGAGVPVKGAVIRGTFPGPEQLYRSSHAQ